MAYTKPLVLQDAIGGLPIVRDYMDTRVHTVRAETGILEAVSFLLKNRVTGAPVVDSEGRLIGMLTEKDCLKLLSSGVDGEVPRGQVKEYMTTELTAIPPEMDVYYAAGLFLKHSFRRLPIVEDGRLVGAITRFDILRVIQSLLR